MKKNLIKIIGVVVFTLFCGSLFINNIDVVAKNKVIQINDEVKKSDNEKKLADLEAKRKDLQAKEISLKLQKNEEFSTNGFTQRYYELSNELEDIADELWDVEREIDKLESSVEFDDAVDMIEDITDTTIDEAFESNNVVEEKKNSFFNIVFIIPIIMFVVVFVVIIISFVRTSRGIGTMFSGNSTKEMLNDLSDVAVKMAKDLNPTYKEFKCPNCNAALDPENTDIKKCNYCGAKLYKTVNTSHSNNSHVHKSHSHTSSSHSSNTHNSNSHKTK